MYKPESIKNIKSYLLYIFLNLIPLFEIDVFSSDPFEEFEHSLDLDVAGKYWMFWTPDDETQTITFEVKSIFVVDSVLKFSVN